MHLALRFTSVIGDLIQKVPHSPWPYINSFTRHEFWESRLSTIPKTCGGLKLDNSVMMWLLFSSRPSDFRADCPKWMNGIPVAEVVRKNLTPPGLGLLRLRRDFVPKGRGSFLPCADPPISPLWSWDCKRNLIPCLKSQYLPTLNLAKSRVERGSGESFALDKLPLIRDRLIILFNKKSCAKNGGCRSQYRFLTS